MSFCKPRGISKRRITKRKLCNNKLFW